MANGKMKLELLLKGVDQMSGVVKKQSVFLKQLDKDATKTYKSLKKLFDFKPKGNFSGFGKQSSSEFRKANSEALKYKKTLELLGKVKMPKINIPSGSTGGNGFPKTNLAKGQKELDKIYNSRRTSNKYLNGLANLNDRVFEPAGQIKNVWKEQYDSLKPYVEETKKLYRAQEKFKLFDLPEADNKRAFDSVKQIVKDIRGASLTDATEDLIDLYGALGDLTSATKSLPLATKFRTNFTALYGDKFSSEEIGTQIQSGFKFLEIIGATNKGVAETERMFDVITKISNSTGGRVTGANFLAMAKTGKTSVKNLSTEGLMNISSMIEEGGAGNTGTALMSMYQALVAGVMKQSAAERFDYFGLLDESKIEYNKAGRIKRLKPGANALGSPMQEDPLKAADMLREAMAKHGVNTNDAKEVDEQLSILFQNRNAQALMSSLINQRDQVAKEAGRAKQAKGILGMDKQLANSELKKIQEFEAAIKNFKTEAGMPLIQIGTKLASSLTPILQFFGNHPTVTQFAVAAMLVGKGFSGIVQSAALLKGSGLTSLFSGASNSAGNASTKVAGFTRNLDTAANKTSAFQKIAGSPITVSLIATGAILAVDTLKQHWDELDARIQKTSENAQSIKQTYDNLMGRGLLYNPAGDYKGNQPEFDNLAKKFVESIQEGNTLETNLRPESASWWDHYKNLTELPYGSYGKTGGQFNPTVAAHRWTAQGFGQGFQDPNYLARVIQQIQSGGEFTKREGETEARKMNFDEIKLVLSSIEKMAGAEKFQAALSILQGITNNPQPAADPNKGQAFINPRTGLFELPKQPAAQPQSFLQPFKEGMSDLSGNTKQVSQTFGQIQQPASGVSRGFFDLSGKGATLGGSFAGLNANTSSSAGAINSMTGAALGFANTVNTLKIVPPSFGTINIPGLGQVSNPPAKTQSFGTPPNPNIARLFGGGKAKGGSVNKRKAYMVGEAGAEMFLPEASGSIIPNDALRSRRNTNAVAQNTTVHNHFNITGTNADEIANKVLSRLEARIADLEFDTSPERMAQRVVYAAKRDSERI